MNIILIKPDELNGHSAAQDRENQKVVPAHTTVYLSDWRAKHIIEILRAQIGDSVKIGIFNGKLGIAHITSLSQQSSEVTLKISASSVEQRADIPIVSEIASTSS